MAMKTMIRKLGNTVIVSLGGFLDYETTNTLKEDLNKIHLENITKQVVFDFSELEFVGSSGISAFVQTLMEFNRSASNKPQYTNVKAEFIRIMTAFDDACSFDFGPGDRTLKNLKAFIDN